MGMHYVVSHIAHIRICIRITYIVYSCLGYGIYKNTVVNMKMK